MINLNTILKQAEKVPPGVKIQLLKAMGFRPSRTAHTGDCPKRTSSGYLCNCVPDPTVWLGPEDVIKHMGETWEERLAQRRAEKTRD